MVQNILVINHSDSELSNINTLIVSEFNQLNIFTTNNLTNIFDQIINYSPDIILFDIDFPEKKILDTLKKVAESVKVPVIVSSQTNTVTEIFESGAILFLQKPYSITSLTAAIKTSIKFIDTYKSLELTQKEIEIKNKHIEWQHDNVLKQRDIITQKNNEIMADIRYASRIQQAILPDISKVEEMANHYFLLHLPRSYVSGDFYWISKSKEKIIIAVGDCTGHGVSGALMHMLGTVYLNDIIASESFEKASDILEQLREKIMHLLNQRGKMGETQDGLDIALCIIDCNSKKLQFAGANNPIYIIRNNELIEYKGDRMPVGIHINFNKPFNNQDINLQPDDKIYLFSDGYADQFGGENGKKFRYKHFQELLLKINHLTMYQQKEILEKRFIEWRGSLDQIDDVLVFGLKIK
ncbi:MAG: hypothetical protein A2X13_08950 [Bacteroidetes bacterium GWC2_33_15]|nr:MAG: hypothetical protein A2X10_01580 [Bacteroidetes bacterium GWA2_33_15]OFX49079.1 MAG: hypothetical protein A2X13_08950 [Bacteroidetes bacterium GWC2_33_15]OFX64848.1 MAG: hypothetical protein A2X15_05830 [Bacteroidetes bacterium GWB2_32_14]OFX68556.1 MAG: hypothetical protein A2X14_14395 [Bacteroidetes bacterium GWD2_33_33]HAN17399.1 hypothetical protein [Bacteroidales bacterium]